MEKKTKLIIIGVVGVLIIITIFASITTVGTGEVGIKTRFGKVQDEMIQEGINLKVPFIERIIKIDCKTKKIEEEAESSTKDMQDVTAKIAVNYNVNKETANILYREIGKKYEEIIIEPAMQESIKSAMAQFTSEELITKRSDVSNKIQEILTEKISDKGFNITGFNIINLNFSDEYNEAIEQKAVKKQEVETAKAELEKQQIENERKIENAKAEAEVMRQQNLEITENTLRLKMLEKWNGQLPTTVLKEDILSLFNIKE